VQISQELKALPWLVNKEGANQDACQPLGIKYKAGLETFQKHKNQFFQLENKLRALGLRFQTIIRKKKDSMSIEVLPESADKGKAL